MVFEDYWSEKREYESKNKRQMIRVVPQESPLFNYSILFKTIDDIDKMTDSELRNFINNSFQSIMINIFDRDIGAKYVNTFRNPRFLDAFIDVISQFQFFEPDVIVKLNLLCYHYITLRDKNPEIVNRMIKISFIINRIKALQLKKFGLSEKLENYLLIARYSDFNLDICIKRVNLIIMTNKELLEILKIDPSTEASQESVEFLGKLLYELYPDWSYVLGYFMLDVIPEYDENNPNTQWVTPEVECMYSTISLAILYILDVLLDSSISLISALKSYSEGYRLMNDRKPIRFSFQQISYEYSRLQSVLYTLENEEKIYVP